MEIGTRVQIPVYKDEWMQGDRFGEVIRYTPNIGMVRVKLDKSGREIPALADDCRVEETRTYWAPGDQEHDHALCEDSVAERQEQSGTDAVSDYLALSWELYGIFVTLVDFVRKSGRTHVNSERAAAAALRALGVDDTIVSDIRKRYRAGVRATAELDHEGKI